MMNNKKINRILSAICALAICLGLFSCASILPDGGEGAGGTGIAARERTTAKTEPDTEPFTETDENPEDTDIDTDEYSNDETDPFMDPDESSADTKSPEDTSAIDTSGEVTVDSSQPLSPDTLPESLPVTSENQADTTKPEETTAPAGGPVKKITVTNDSGVATVGSEILLTAHVFPENAGNTGVVWSIYSGGAYATVSEEGILTAWKTSKVVVKCTSRENSKIYALFTVTPKVTALWNGSGTAAKPYLIECAEDLRNLNYACYTSGLYFKQIADIDLSDYKPWTPIGYGHGVFCNNYDGNGYKITGLTLGEIKDLPYRPIETGYLGLFAELGSGVTVSGLTVECTGEYQGFVSAAGIICGKATSVTLKRVNVSGSLSFPKCSYIGGLSGDFQGNIVLCSSKTDINSKGSHIGGLAGYLNGGVARSFADGNITGGYFCGGLVGYADGGSSFINCYSAGSVTSTSATVGNTSLDAPVALSSWRPAGGLIGCLACSGTAAKPSAFQISYCYTRATVNAACSPEYASSLVGYICDTLSKELYAAGSKYYMGSQLISNYALSTADQYAHPREFVSGYEHYGEYKSQQIQVCKNITEKELLKKDTFGKWDFKTIWKMGEKGPELIGF